MGTGIVIQARTGSSRLPKKMVLPFFEDKNVLELIIERLKLVYSQLPIILATTNKHSDNELESLAENLNVVVYRGDEKNVLSRFLDVAEKYNFNNVIRVCPDNPFLDVIHIQNLLDEMQVVNADYISYDFGNGTPTILSHLGLFTEIVKTSALRKIASSTTNVFYLEHVTNYIYTHPKNFLIKLLPLPSYLKNNTKIRLTLDTLDDFLLQKQIYQKMYARTPLLSTEKLIKFIEKEPSFLAQMKTQIELNRK